jgi:hypothetical protein
MKNAGFSFTVFSVLFTKAQSWADHQFSHMWYFIILKLIVQGWSSSIIVIFPSIKHEVHPSSSQVPWAVSSFILKIYFCIGNKLGHKVGRLENSWLFTWKLSYFALPTLCDKCLKFPNVLKPSKLMSVSYFCLSNLVTSASNSQMFSNLPSLCLSPTFALANLVTSASNSQMFWR